MALEQRSKLRFVALAGFACAFAMAAPARASVHDQFPCRSADHETLLVQISGFDSDEAVMQAVPIGGGPAHSHELRRKPGGSWADFRYEDDQHHVFVGGAGKGVLLMHAKAYACEFAGEPGEAQRQAHQDSHVLLGPDGLDIVAPGISLPDGIAFGVSEAQVVGELSKVLGKPGQRLDNDECGGGPMSFRRFGGLTLNFSEGKWVGWLLDSSTVGGEDGVPVSLQNGLTIGARAGDLASGKDYDPDSTLGDEFTVEGISGLSAGKGGDAPIDTLWAGSNCLFR